MNPKTALDPSWFNHLKDEFNKPYMHQLNAFMQQQTDAGKTILPPVPQRFNALNSMTFDQLKVVIIGQDPYPTEGHAHGLCFSVLPEIKPLPKSLLNINKELLDDLGIDNSQSGYLQKWADQGVLLLNSVLTVEKGKANAHQGKGWEHFTDAVIRTINDAKENVVFILWGAYAQKKGALIDDNKHHIITSAHPSPLSAYRGFYGSKPFSKTNNTLIKQGKQPIDWAI